MPQTLESKIAKICILIGRRYQNLINASASYNIALFEHWHFNFVKTDAARISSKVVQGLREFTHIPHYQRALKLQVTQIAYALCAITSLICFVLLARSYLQTRVTLLMWSSAAFFFFALQNAILFVDLVLVPGTSLLWWRNMAGFIGAVVLLFGLISEK